MKCKEIKKYNPKEENRTGKEERKEEKKYKQKTGGMETCLYPVLLGWTSPLGQGPAGQVHDTTLSPPCPWQKHLPSETQSSWMMMESGGPGRLWQPPYQGRQTWGERAGEAHVTATSVRLTGRHPEHTHVRSKKRFKIWEAKRTHVVGKTGNSEIMAGDLNSHLLAAVKAARQEISRKIEDLNNYMNHFIMTALHGPSHPVTDGARSCHVPVVYSLWQMMCATKQTLSKRVVIIQSIGPDLHEVLLTINNNEVTRKTTNTWR